MREKKVYPVQGSTGLKGEVGATGLKGDKGDVGAVGTRGQPGVQGAEGIKGQKGEPADVDSIIESLTSPISPSINFLNDTSIYLTQSDMDGTDLLIGEWINIDHQDKELWQGATSLLIEYYVTDEIDSADWKLDFTTSVDDTQSVVTFGPIFASPSSNSCQKYIGQIFIPVSSEGNVVFKFSCSKQQTISLYKLRVVAFI